MGYDTMIAIILMLLVVSLWETGRSIQRGVNERLLAMRKQVRHDLQLLEIERARIANDLHDELGPLLAAVSIRLNIVEAHTEKEEGNLQKIKTYVAETVERIGEIALDLNPVILTSRGLQGALQEFIYRQEEAANVELDYVFQIKSKVPDVTSLHVYRMVQELVYNGLKHSKAKSIQVCLFDKDTTLHLLYADNGIGFDADESRRKKGMGLYSLKTRTDILAGKMKITTTPGRGVEYYFEIPL